MFTNLKTKLLIGLTPLLAITVGLGLWAVAMFGHLGGRIDVILRENYESVIAAEGMKEALERMDSAALFAVNGRDDAARRQFIANKGRFDEELARERSNVTLPGEQQLADRLGDDYRRYLDASETFYKLSGGVRDERWASYERELLPRFNEVKDAADEVLRLNQANMKVEDRRAREAAERSMRVMVFTLLGAVGVATVIALALARSLLEPIKAVTRSTRALAKGDYDQVVPVTSRDELGELATTFNGMARMLREYRQAGTARLVRAQKTAQATIDSFPDPVVVVDPIGSIERANPAAGRVLGVKAVDDSVPWTPPPALRNPISEVLGGRPDYVPTGVEHAICLRDDGQERFYLPRVLAIRGEDEPLGAAIVLHDVTKFRLVDELKSDMVATVSHELKTPLTSIQMVVHLLLEEVVGPLDPKQVELLLAARQDADRLLAMVNDLLDLTRIEQGRVRLDLRPVSTVELAGGAASRFEARARDAGIELSVSVGPEVPSVLVDRERIEHVFDNLLVNAIGHTGRGGWIRLIAEVDADSVLFEVKDSGEGIPAEHLGRLFDRFYRVPGTNSSGAGLGLAIAREIVVGHGGQIEVSSGGTGQGTTFTVRLPIAPVAGEASNTGGRTP